MWVNNNNNIRLEKSCKVIGNQKDVNHGGHLFFGIMEFI